MICSYHNHTMWSDGKGSVLEMIEEAERLSLNEVGISDHYTLTHDERGREWSMAPDALAQYVESVVSVRSPKVIRRVGVEADFFPETVDEVRELLAKLPFDYVIGSVHFVDSFAIDSAASDWTRLSVDEVNSVWRGYWLRIRRMAESRVFDIAAHLDLPKKFGFRPTVKLESEENSALKAIAESGMAIEINTNGWNLPAAEAYPSLQLLKRAHDLHIPLIISSDAHVPGRLIERFDDAKDLARAAGYTSLVRFDSRRRTPAVL